MTHSVTLIPGDWIGPEVAKVAKVVIAAAGVSIDWDEQPVDEAGITESVLESCRHTGVVLKGRINAPRIEGHLPPTVQLRKALGLWSTVRPVTALPNIGARFKDIDVIVVRETSEDIYAGFEHEVTDGVYEAVKITTRTACERIARAAFELAVTRGRKKVTIVHKSNIMKKSDGMFLRVAQDVALEFPQIEAEEAIVDALCMRLVKWPMPTSSAISCPISARVSRVALQRVRLHLMARASPCSRTLMAGRRRLSAQGRPIPSPCFGRRC